MKQLKPQHATRSAETIDADAFAKVTESLFKRAKSMKQNELDRVVADKTAAYEMALHDVDSAKALLSEIAEDISSDGKAVLEAAVKSVDYLTMFQGDAAMDQNSQWMYAGFPSLKSIR